MTVEELRETLPTMVIWMAKEAVMEGVKAYYKSQRQREIERQKEDSGEPYNYMLANAYYDGVRIAAEVLWKLFSSCSHDCLKAIKTVARKRDGWGNPDDYFNDFVIALEEQLNKFEKTVQIRTEE